MTLYCTDSLTVSVGSTRPDTSMAAPALAIYKQADASGSALSLSSAFVHVGRITSNHLKAELATGSIFGRGLWWQLCPSGLGRWLLLTSGAAT